MEDSKDPAAIRTIVDNHVAPLENVFVSVFGQLVSVNDVYLVVLSPKREITVHTKLCNPIARLMNFNALNDPEPKEKEGGND